MRKLCITLLLIASSLCGLAGAAEPLAEIQQVILHSVDHVPPSREAHRRYRTAQAYGTRDFPSDDDLASPSNSPMLAKWLAMTPEQRRYDVLISPDTDYYWVADGHAYSCLFIVHIEMEANGRPRLDLMQAQPTWRIGKEFKFRGSSGPGFYDVLQPGKPSPQTEAAFRNFLWTSLQQQ